MSTDLRNSKVEAVQTVLLGSTSAYGSFNQYELNTGCFDQRLSLKDKVPQCTTLVIMIYLFHYYN